MSHADEPRRKCALRLLLSRLAALFGVHFYDMLYGEKDLNLAIPEVESRIDVRIAEAAEDDVEELAALLDANGQRHLRRAVQLGGRCFVARCGGRIAGCSWVNAHVIDLVGMTVARLPDDVAYTYNSCVFPEFRGNRVFQCLTRAVYTDVKEKGGRFVCNLVDRRNAASIAARTRLGAQFQNARVLKLPGLRPLILGRKFVIGRLADGAPVSSE